jgi:hypothetical protein
MGKSSVSVNRSAFSNSSVNAGDGIPDDLDNDDNNMIACQMIGRFAAI